MKKGILILFVVSLLISGCSLGKKQKSPVPITLEVVEEITSLPSTAIPEVTSETVNSLRSDNFRLGASVNPTTTEEQLSFINANYDFVMSHYLHEIVREAVQGPDLILYRSIQGTWEGFNHLDWEHINATENMFEHHNGERILTIWNSWLMNADDLVAPDDPNAMDHWINYYAKTVSEQIYEYDFDGLFIDSASHRLGEGAVRGIMPDDYDAEEWYQGRVEGLAFIKSYLPDKTVVFNGLHSRAGAEDSLANTDGGMWEVFAFKETSGEYQGVESWFYAIDMTNQSKDDAGIILMVKWQPNLEEDIQKRIFSVASYLLVSNENVIFAMTNEEEGKEDYSFFYPEYTLDLGAPLGDFTISDDESYAKREFEKGFVLVNPHEDQSVSYELDGEYLRVIPVGGGAILEDGIWEGSLEHESISGQIELPPVSAMILLKP